jgi:gamma-glutamylputrescine oxidase
VAIGGYSGTGNLVGPVAARAAVAVLVDGVRPAGYFRSSL